MSKNSLSHTKELKKVTDELKKFTVEDFKKAESILSALDKYDKFSLRWNGKEHISFEEALDMLRLCMWYADKNNSSEF